MTGQAPPCGENSMADRCALFPLRGGAARVGIGARLGLNGAPTDLAAAVCRQVRAAALEHEVLVSRYTRPILE